MIVVLGQKTKKAHGLGFRVPRSYSVFHRRCRLLGHAMWATYRIQRRKGVKLNRIEAILSRRRTK